MFGIDRQVRSVDYVLARNLARAQANYGAAVEPKRSLHFWKQSGAIPFQNFSSQCHDLGLQLSEVNKDDNCGEKLFEWLRTSSDEKVPIFC